MSLAALAGLVILSAAGAAAPPCPPLPGAETLVARREVAWLIVGETHGTRELPELFGDLVCHLAEDRRAVTVGLEFLAEEQAAFEAYLASDGGPRARAELLASAGWGDRVGRASEAMFDLVDNLRRLRAAGSDLEIAAFDHPAEGPVGTSAAREEGMARNLIEARRRRPEALVVALTGSGHAGRDAWTSLGPPFPSMTQHLPTDATLTVAHSRPGGEIWACRRSSEAEEAVCGAWPAQAREPLSARGVWLDATRPGFDAALSAGRPYTPSPPARESRGGN